MNRLMINWVKFIKSGLVVERHFTKDLYEAVSIEPGFIAHFNREGFIKARFRTLGDLDQTLQLLTLSKRLDYLVKDMPAEVLAEARYKVAARESSLLKQRAKVLAEHAKQLQRKFQRAL